MALLVSPPPKAPIYSTMFWGSLACTIQATRHEKKIAMAQNESDSDYDSSPSLKDACAYHPKAQRCGVKNHFSVEGMFRRL